VGEYLILEGDLLPRLLASKQIFLSPFGGAPKDGKPLTECARIVHDDSFPRNGGLSVNDATTNIPLEVYHDKRKAMCFTHSSMGFEGGGSIPAECGHDDR
jgi:hypothetical protein